ncbi:hypothetical protein LTR85_010357 [Meristemomyces frigidus]|nr:hypothetical protein LTR85_010357 [Meristemomyces frigidus]
MDASLPCPLQPQLNTAQQQATNAVQIQQATSTYNSMGTQGQFGPTQYQQPFQVPQIPQAPAHLPQPPAPAPMQPAIDWDSLKASISSSAAPSQQVAAAQAQTLGTQTVTTTINTTTTHKWSNEGGQARRAAEAGGQAAVDEYEQKVQTLINQTGNCPRRFPWYNALSGYLCGDGHHFVPYKEIDRCFLGTTVRVPEFLKVNSMMGGGLIVHPPDVDHWQPMHNAHRKATEWEDVVYIQTSKDQELCECAKAANERIEARSHERFRPGLPFGYGLGY